MIAARSSRRLNRWLVGTLAIVLASLLAPAGVAHAAGDVPVPPDTGLTDKGAGDVSAADKDFVIKVRLSDFWAILPTATILGRCRRPKGPQIGPTPKRRPPPRPTQTRR